MGRYDESVFGATHNSYSGGDRGSLPDQLTAGIRCVELDFHDNGYEGFRDYRVGHLGPGAEVATGHGNPSSVLLKDWLGVVSQWSEDHPDHSPITVVLDSKDDLTDNDGGGDLEDLNAALRDAFGMKLYTAELHGDGPWPDVDELGGRILCVLSGDAGTRRYYRWTLGSTPTIAANAGGEVVLAYRSTSGDLRCWNGRIELAASGVQWRRRATYRFSNAPLVDPAVALNDDSWVVAVHWIPGRKKPHFRLPVVESVVGRLTSGHINWFSRERFALGHRPTVEISGDEIRSVYHPPTGSGRKVRTGKLNRLARRIDWGKERATSAKLIDSDTARWQSHVLACRAGSGGEIQVRVDGGRYAPVRFEQVAFIEQQVGNDDTLLKNALFFAAHWSDEAALQAARVRGQVVRAWSFKPKAGTAPRVNLPATDDPARPLYRAYLEQSGAIEYA